MDRYINPFIDYGFKKLFATETNKDLLISFLNAIIDDWKDPILDLVYKNVEQIGEFNGIRASYFDVYCETKSGRQFIVEMQNSWKPFFYAAKPIRDQGLNEMANGDRKRRKKTKDMEERPEWDYHLKEVYLIAIMNFTFPQKEYKLDSFFHKVMLTDVDDNHVFYDKLTLYYVEMPKLDNVSLNLTNPRDKWLFALYHLWRYDEYPEELPDEIFQKFYEQAEYAHWTPDQQLTYERSEKFYLDTINEIRGGRMLGHEEGFIEGKEEGFIEGKEKGLAEGKELGLTEGEKNGEEKSKLEIARKMKALQMDPSIILEVTGLTRGDLEKISTVP